MYIDPAIIGKTFTIPNDPNNVVYTCRGYSNTGTLLVIAFVFDAVNNRTETKTFKLSDVRFIGKI